jgi:hypothetical protein
MLLLVLIGYFLLDDLISTFLISGLVLLIVRNVTGLKYHHLPDSPSIFVDTDGKGYIAFTHEGISRLTGDSFLLISRYAHQPRAGIGT